MTTPPGSREDLPGAMSPGVSFVPDEAMVRLIRERDNLFLLHEALAEVDRAPSLQARLTVFVDAIQRVGFGRVVMTVRDAELNPVEIVTGGMTADEDHMLRTGAASGAVWQTRLARMEPFRISQSYYVDSSDPWVASEFGDALPSHAEPNSQRSNWSPHDFLFVPLRTATGRIIATLILDDPADRTKPTLARVRTVELFAQQVASLLEREELYAESLRERSRGEALADVARAVSSSLRLENVLDLSLRHAVALLHASGATISLVRGDQLVIVAAIGPADSVLGQTLPLTGSLSGRALRDREFIIANDARRDPEAYAPNVRAAGVDRAVMVPLYGSEGPLGVLTVINRSTPFDEADANVLQRLGDHVAIAVANARLFEEHRELGERYRSVVETTADAIVITNCERRIVFTNRAAEELLGRGATVMGRPVSDFVPEDELPEIRRREDLALAGEPQRYESMLLRTDGERRLLSISNSPMRSPGGEVVGVVASLRDVTEERRARDKVAQSEARYARLVESASDGIFTVDPQGNITAVNRSLERSVGRGRDEILGTPFAALLDSRDQLLGAQLFYEAYAGQSRHAELRYVAADGSTRFCSVMTTPIHEDGSLAGVLGIVRDVTDEKRLMEQLVQQEKLAAVGQLVSGVAHELNNPLAGVMAFSQLLLASPAATPEQRPALETIDAEAKRAAKIVANLLTFARQHQPERAATDLNQVLLDTLELRRYALRVSQIQVVLKLDPTLPTTWADAFQLQQVALNLLANAEQAMEGWQGERRIALGTRNSGGTLILSVSDSGPGIASDDLPRIFNPFFTTKAVGQGTGLGLSISDGIVREHGGRIRVESRIGQGATFYVELPHVSAPATAAMDVPVTSEVAVEGRRVLVADDEPSIRSAIATFLRSLGHSVDTFSSGRDVLERIASQDYDVLVLDLRMPEMSGDVLYAELESRAPRLARRVVFLTGDIQSDATRGFLESTGRPIVTKPFMLDELAAVVLAEAAT